MKQIGIVGFDQVQLLDIAGPYEVFAYANRLLAEQGKPAAYQVYLLGMQGECLQTSSGMRISPDLLLEDAVEQLPKLNSLIIAGGEGVQALILDKHKVECIALLSQSAERVCSVCTGAFILAEAGLLRDKTVATHWRASAFLQDYYPDTVVDHEAIYVKDGRFYTSAGITSGIDMALALIEEDLGHRLAMAIAKELVVYLRRAGGQKQYSDLLQAQTIKTDAAHRYAQLLDYLALNLHKPITVEMMAEIAKQSLRHFSREFKLATGQSPAKYLQTLRLEKAKFLLENTQLELKALAYQSGFQSDDRLRKVFQRHYQISPMVYRARFGSHHESSNVPTKLIEA